MSKKEIRKWLYSACLVLLAALYPVIFTYAQNVAEVDFVEVLPLVFWYPAVGLTLWAVLSLTTKSPSRSALSAVLLVFFLSNYMLIQKVVQMVFADLKYWHILPIGLFLLGHVIYLLYRFREEIFGEIVPVGALVMVALLLINLVPAAPTILQKMAADSKDASVSDAVEVADQPNIYWLVFDECASFSVAENFYQYSDKTNYNKLVSQGFYVSDTSRNEATDTHRVMTNCVNLDYVVDPSMDPVEIEMHRDDPLLYQVLRERGYTLRGIGDTQWMYIDSLTTEIKDAGETADGVGVVEMQLRNSVIAPFLSDSRRETAKLVLDTLDYYQNPDNITPNRSQFNFLYVCSPHVPFLFDEEGNDVAAANYNNWDDPKFYLGQYRFIMDQIVEITETIIEQDPQSVIIVQSDHGPRHSAGLTFEDKTSVLNCVYYMGEDISQIEGKSAVNTLRIVLNRLLGCDFEEVPVSHEE